MRSFFRTGGADAAPSVAGPSRFSARDRGLSAGLCRMHGWIHSGKTPRGGNLRTRGQAGGPRCR